MSLIDLAVGVALGQRRAPDSLSLALFDGGKEIVDAGYQRHAIAKGGWSLRTGSASVPCRFGPFAKIVSFDRAVLMRGTDVVEEVPMTAQQTIAPGTVYDHEFVAVWGKA